MDKSENVLKHPKARPIKPLPFPVYYWTAFLLALAGLGDSVYLAISHYRVYTDIAYSSFCALSKSFNCDTVSQSPHSILLGVPVPVWGVVGYLFVIALLMLARQKRAGRKRIWPVLFFVSGAYSAYSVFLAAISSFSIHSYCIMCMVSYAVNFLLWYDVWIIRKRFDAESVLSGIKKDLDFLWQYKHQSAALLLPVAVAVLCLPFVFPVYWQLQAPELSNTVPTGVTEDGHPWIGAVNPQLTIVEFTDYQCFQCKKMHFFLRHIINTHHDKIRLIHRHFPMDHRFNPIVKEPFHVGSGVLAMVAIYATGQDKFWQVNDYLFNRPSDAEALDLREPARLFGFNATHLVQSLNHPDLNRSLMSDIREGIRWGINGTPGYLIDGRLYLANIPPDILKAYIR